MSPNARPPRRATRPADSGMAFVLALFALTTIAMAATSALLVPAPTSAPRATTARPRRSTSSPSPRSLTPCRW